MLRWTFLLVIPLFIFTACGDLEPEMQDTRTVILNMDFHKRSSSRSSPSVSASELSQYKTHLILALPSLEYLSSSYKNFFSSFAQELMNPDDKKVSLEIPLNTQMKIFAFLFKENYSMSKLFSGVREVGYYGESRSFSINTNTNSLSLGITLKAASGNEDDSTGTGAGTGDTTAPTSSVTTATITNSGNAVVQSTETGTAYLVNTAVTVSNLASITGAADSQWNSVDISSANTNTNLAATGLEDGTYKVYAVDAAGNLSSASTNSVTLDTTAPTISSVTAGWDTSLNATEDNSAGTVTVVTSGAENGQTVTVALNGTNYTGTVSNNSTSVTVAAAGLQALTDGSSYTLTTNVSDAAGNAATENTGTSFTYDITAPTISDSVAISSASGVQNSLLNAGDNVSVTATFSESVIVDSASGTPTLTLVVGSTDRTATYASGSGSTPLVFQYTIQAGETDSDGISIGANTLALNSGTIMDASGNNATLTHSAVSANTSYKVDTTAPSVNSFTLSDTALKAGDTATVTLVFSEAVASFSSSADITADNGTLAAMTSSDNVTWTGTFTPTTNTEDASNTLSLATSYTDTAGNAGPAATTANYAVDTQVPTISSVTAGWGTYLNATEDDSDGTVTVVTSGAENGQTVTVALNSANYTGTVSDNSTSVTIAASGLQALTNGSSYTLTTNVSNAAGNAATENTGTSFTYDITAPTLAETTVVPSLTNDNSTQYTFSSTEGGTISIGGSCSNSSDNNTAVADNMTVSFAALADGAYGNCTITVTDSAGNSVTLDVNSFTIDTTAPTLAEVTAVTTPTNDNTSSYTFSSTEAGTISYSICGGNLDNASADNNTIIFNALADGPHIDCKISVTDNAGNTSENLSVSSFTIDTIKPVLAQVTAVTTPTNVTTPSYVFSSNEAGTISYGGSCGSSTTSSALPETTQSF